MWILRASTRCLSLAGLALVVGAMPAASTSYVRLDDTALVERAPVIVEGRIVALEAARAGRIPAVDYLVKIERLIKGHVDGASLSVRVPGGVGADGVGLAVRGAPRFQPATK